MNAFPVIFYRGSIASRYACHCFVASDMARRRIRDVHPPCQGVILGMALGGSLPWEAGSLRIEI
jgi:hypothetical protein